MGKTFLDRAMPKRMAAVVAILAVLGHVSGVSAYTTTSPEVRQMVDRAVGFLETASEGRPGGQAVIGLALLKNQAPPTDPVVVAAAAAVQKAVRGSDLAYFDIYSTGLSIIFLISLDSDKYRSEIDALLQSLLYRQKPHGGWGYPDKPTGDTSMTQYGVLSIWEARQKGFQIPQQSIQAVTRWLLQTQDPSGAWGYQGYPSTTFQPIPQSEIRHSLAAAGLGSVYICADLLSMNQVAEPQGQGVPAALKEISRRDLVSGMDVRMTVSTDLIRATQQRGNGWFQAEYRIDPPREAYYYLYALERYGSFRELAEGRGGKDPAKVEGPQWYNDGVEFLRKTQETDGGWDTASQCGKPVNTAFGVLFLLRSAQKSIRRARGFGPGTLVGGRGALGAVVDAPKEDRRTAPISAFEALRAAMEQQEPDAQNMDAVIERIDQLPPKESQLFVSENQQKLRQLAGDPSPEKRVAAIMMLSRAGDFDNVPVLILALRDRNTDVMIAAREGLRRMSRKLDDFGPPNQPTDRDRDEAVERWKAWYHAIRPDTEF
jgi:hypothetical protein